MQSGHDSARRCVHDRRVPQPDARPGLLAHPAHRLPVPELGSGHHRNELLVFLTPHIVTRARAGASVIRRKRDDGVALAGDGRGKSTVSPLVAETRVPFVDLDTGSNAPAAPGPLRGRRAGLPRSRPHARSRRAGPPAVLALGAAHSTRARTGPSRRSVSGSRSPVTIEARLEAPPPLSIERRALRVKRSSPVDRRRRRRRAGCGRNPHRGATPEPRAPRRARRIRRACRRREILAPFRSSDRGAARSS